MTPVEIAGRKVGVGFPTYFVADIAANHDGDLRRAQDLIRLAARAGADAAKFQNFRANQIVSEVGFQQLGKHSHQASWKKPVFQVYQEASIPFSWTPVLAKASAEAGIDYFSSAYDLQAVDELGDLFPAIKIGSGDITWTEILERIASKGKPVLLATGASDLADVQRAVAAIRELNPQIVLMQCNTNYTGSTDNFDHIHLNVITAYAAIFPDLVLGLSDHTPGHATVLGAVALGARVIEKHFTDDRAREGPDHAFSMDPDGWRDMVDRTRELERALGSPEKRVADNELETVVVQRRCIRAARDLPAGTVITRDLLDILRPSPPRAIQPYEIEAVLGTLTARPIPAGAELRWTDLVAP
ncbi:MAG: N-acetylneuraminate synthase family protein [Anaerolineales bacterium]